VPILDQFRICVRQCKPIEPEGYEVVLEIRRKPEGGEKVKCPPGTAPDRPDGDQEVAK
jgi:hypothetical protein